MDSREEMIRGTVKQYPYRTASIRDVFLTLPREDLKGLEEQLADVAGTHTDNHTVYEIAQNGSTTYLKFTDFSVYFGHAVEPKTH